MLQQFTDKTGKKRLGVVTHCQICNKEFVKRKGKSYANKGKYCSLACRDKARSNTTQLVCGWCKKCFSRPTSKLKLSRSGIHFCCRKCKDEAQKLGGIKEIMPAHYGTAKVPEYRSLFTEDELVCKRCNYNEFTVAVQIHHIDEDRTNNDKSNLIPLCANCHWALHNNKWNIKEIFANEKV